MAAPIGLTCVRPCNTIFRTLCHRNLLLRHRNVPIRVRNCSDYSKSKTSHQRALQKSLGIEFLKLCGSCFVGGALGYTIKRIFWKPASTTDDVVVPPRMHRSYQPIRYKDTECGLNLTLYHDRTNPQCSQVRVYLDHHKISYDLVEIHNQSTAKELKWTLKKNIPMLVCHDVGKDGFLQISDSAVIIGVLESLRINPDTSIDDIVQHYPSEDSTQRKYFIKSAQFREEEEKWRRWADEKLVPLLAPNIYRTRREAIEAARYFEEDGNWTIHFSSSARWQALYTASVFNYVANKWNMIMHQREMNAREALYRHCNRWIEAISKEDRQFMGGEKPNLADLAVYGALSSIEGCETFQDLMDNTNVGKWYGNMKSVVTHIPWRNIVEAQTTQ